MQFWNELEGQILDGYPLLRLVRSEGRTAWFETEIREATAQSGTISLTESLTDAEEVIARLEEALRIQHPNLVSIRKIGQGRLDRTLYVYALMEHADQNLADVLQGQALSPTEARQVAEAMVRALTELHQRGLVHGRVEPDSILAIGESVKLRSDCLQSPGGTRAGDVAGIGATLFEALTQQKASSADDAQINRIPAPFAEIVRNSLSSRWNLAQIASVLKIPAAGAPAERPAPAVTPPVTPEKVPAPPVTPAKAPALPAVPPATASTAPAKPSTPAQPPARPPARPKEPQGAAKQASIASEPEKPTVKSRPTLLYAALVVVFLLLLLWLLFRPKSHQSANPAPTATNQSAAAPSLPRAPSSVPPPQSSRRRADHGKPSELRPVSPEVAQTPGDPGAGSTRSIWRVVAYTYKRQDQAEHKADQINQAHQDLQASVFTPGGSRSSYLVVLGGAMDRQQAFATRDKARSEGLPHDTYAQNYSK